MKNGGAPEQYSVPRNPSAALTSGERPGPTRRTAISRMGLAECERRVLLLFLRRRRQQSIEPEVHRGHPVMIRPTAGRTQEGPDPWPWLAIEPGYVLVHLGVAGFCQGGAAEIK